MEETPLASRPGLVLAWEVRFKPWFASLARRLGSGETTTVRRLELDELGTAVWELVDGRRTTAEITALFAGQYRLEPREAELSVTAFLRELGRRGLIAFH